MNPPRTAHPRGLADLVAWVTLAGATLAVLWPLGLTNRILAGIDAFTYFAPYWDFRMAALRAGQIPLWNPYLFLGTPFLANPQAAVLYPLHWPLSWLTPEQALVWSALLHTWLGAGFTYALGRRSFELSRPAAWLAGLIFGLGGFTLARVGNINQLNALAWLPALLWCYDEAAKAPGWRGAVRWGSALAAAIALCLLAGHTQSLFINMVGLAAYALLRILERPRALARRFAPLLAVVPAVLLSAAQLLPTLELNDLGLRTGGLPYRQAVSFSLQPRLLAQTFLPPFGGELGQAFGSEGYAEFVGYIGVVSLVLAGVAAVRGGRAFLAPLSLAGLGVFLAAGAYNPIYYLLWRFAPGFDLFRAPARWLALFALGAALLAGAGLDRLEGSPRLGTLRRASKRKKGLLAAAAIAAGALLVLQRLPPAVTLAGWLIAAAAAAALLSQGGRSRNFARYGLIALALGELWLSGRSLPFAQATAPLAAGLRNAPAALLAATAEQPPAGRDRFLSLSDIRYDPGDLAELRALQADRLPHDAVELLVRAAKQVEVIAPNLPLRLRLPAVDGYDGGVLPLNHYVKFQSLFLPAETLIPDGRLREQLTEIPDGRLLDLAGVRFVITDKQRDLWVDDVYYDLEQAAALAPGEALTFDLSAYPAFAATEIGLVIEPGEAAASEVAGELRVTATGGEQFRLTLSPQYGAETPMPNRLAFPRPATPIALSVRNTGQQAWLLRGLSLIDTRTAAHTSITVSPRGDFRRIHSGDVKIYERASALGRAWLAHDIRFAADDAAALAALAEPTFDPRTAAVITGPQDATRTAPAGPGETVTVIGYEAERLALRVQANSPALLVVADSFYPGWEAAVDGAPVPIVRANLLFRGVALDAGTHEVILNYRPASWQRGACISLAALALLACSVLVTVFAPGRGRV